MENSNTDYERYQRARKQVNEIKGFYSHFAVYIVVMIILVYINLKYTPEYLWFFWSMLGWGIGVFSHAWKAFNWFPCKEWEQRKIKQFIEEEKQKNKYE